AFFWRHSLLSRFFKGRIRQIGARKALGIHLANMTDTKAEQKAMQGNLAPIIDRIVKLLHGSRAEAFNILQFLERRIRLSLLQREDIGRRFDLQAVIFGMEEKLDLLFAKAFNIERIARYEMTNALN